MTLEEELKRRQLQLEVTRALEQGQKALDENDFSQAETYFKAALELKQDDVSARAGLIQASYRAGVNAEERGRLRDALEHYQGVLQLDPAHHEAQVRQTAIRRKLRVRGIAFGIIGAVLLLLVLAQVNNFIAWPVPVCDASGALLCTPSPTATNTATATATATLTPTPTPTNTPTPTPYLNVQITNPERTPVPVRQIGLQEGSQLVTVCEDCRQVSTDFSDVATNVRAYIELYSEQVILDEDSLPVPAETSAPIPDHDRITSPHYVQWPRWNTGGHSANFVVATVTPTPTPMPKIVRGAAPNPNVLDKPGGTLLFYLRGAVCVYVCDETDDYYQVANGYCHLTAPMGWVPKKHLTEPTISADGCPPVTPAPPPPPEPSPTPTPAPEG